jgi:acylglycerol lipase
LEGEPDDRIYAIHDDIVSWLDSRCSIKWGFSQVH